MSTPISATDFVLDTYEAITRLNSSIDQSSQAPDKLLLDFNGIKSKWEQFKSTPNPGLEARYNSLELALEDIQRRVDKLKVKIPSQTSSTGSQTAQHRDLKLNSKRISFMDFYSGEYNAWLGNFYDCPIALGGRHYSNAESAFLAQLYTDQPHVMAQFEKTDAYGALELFFKIPFTQERFDQWENLRLPDLNKVDVMMEVLRAKFLQNPYLGKRLIDTRDAYLANQPVNKRLLDLFWSEGFDGSGLNMLGICLMKLRGEYGGKGVVMPS